MVGKGPGKQHREGITLMELYDMFPDDKTAEAWFVKTRWPDGIRCGHCDSERVTTKTKHPRMPYHCKDCRKFFSVKTGTVMQSSKLGYRVWALAMYLMTTGIKGAASMKLHRDLGITQKSAWHLAHRLRESWDKKKAKFEGPVEVDETFIGGKEKNKHAKKKKHPGGGYSGKAVVAGIKDHATGQVNAEVVADTTATELQGFVYRNVKLGSEIYTNKAKGYLGMTGFSHKYVKHAVGEYVNEEGATTNAIESIWAIVKRGYHGTYHQMSKKHLQRYVNEFVGRYNDRELDTIDQLRAIVLGMGGKQLKYNDLIA